MLDDEVGFRLDNMVGDTLDDGVAVRLDDKIVVGLDGKVVDTTLDEAVVRLDKVVFRLDGKVFEPLVEVVVTLNIEVVTVAELSKGGLLSGTFVSSSGEKRSGHSLASWYFSSKARLLLIF